MPPLAETASPLDGLASAASVLLIIEASIIILLVAALMLLLAFALRWLHAHVIPPLQAALPVIKGALNTTDRASGRVIDLVASVYSRRKGFEEGLHSFITALGPILTALFTSDDKHGAPPTPPANSAP